MSSVDGPSPVPSGNSLSYVSSDRSVGNSLPLIATQAQARPVIGLSSASTDAVANTIATSMFEIEHRHDETPRPALSLPFGIDPYVVDPFVEAQCPCVLEDMQALLWTLRSSNRRGPARQIGKPILGRHERAAIAALMNEPIER